MKTIKVVSTVALAIALCSCSDLIRVKTNIDSDSDQNSKQTESALSSISANKPAEERLVHTTILHSAWMGSTQVMDKTKSNLPDIFSKDVTFIFPDRSNLSTVAERLTKVIGIPVKPRPDVFIKASELVPKAAIDKSQATTLAPIAPLMPTAGMVGATTTSSDFSLDTTLNYTGSLSGLLDSICAKAGINWEYKDGQIILYRFITKTFTLKSTPGSSQLTASVGKAGGSQTGTTGGTGGSGTGGAFSSDTMVKMGSAFSIWDNLKESVTAMLTPVGKVAVMEATGTVTVTDTREVVEQVGLMLAQINKSLSRQVSFRVEVLSLQTTNTADYGVDWGVVFNKLAQNTPSLQMTMGSPASLASSNAANIAYSILTPSGKSSVASQLSGSNAMLAAMSSLGKASVVTTASALTLNRQPVPVAITDQVSYVQSVTAQTGTAAQVGVPAVGAALVQVNPGVVTTGFILNLLPSITDDNDVLLQFSVDISTLTAMSSFGSGVLAVQTPEVNGMTFLQRVGLKNGQTLVLSGFERTTGQYNRRTLTENSDLLAGGSISGSKTRESIVILVTPVVSDGA